VEAEPEITQRAAQPYVGIRGWVAMAAIGSVADRIPEIFSWLGLRAIAPAGPPFFRYWVVNMEGELEVEAGVPVASAVQGDGAIGAGTLPAGRFVVVTHTGPPSTLVAATAELLDWAGERGLVWDVSRTEAGVQWGCRLEFYLTNPVEQPDASRWQTQLAFKLAD
jgi:effector-binding domain-containing protein